VTEADAAVAVDVLLRYVGEDPVRLGLLGTPDRVARSLREMTSGYRDDPAGILATTFAERSDEMVLVRDIEFWSLCEHHLLPFHGTATVGYLPRDNVVGLSKLARVVHCFARRLQVQERLTTQIASAVMDNLEPLGVGVVVRATHLCMAARGVRSPSTMVTSALLGVMRDADPRAEFLALAGRP
jgi:GTP cyclohydrolase I